MSGREMVTFSKSHLSFVAEEKSELKENFLGFDFFTIRISLTTEKYFKNSFV